MARRPIICKSDLTPALATAKAAGWEQVTVTVDAPDGRRLQIVAGSGPEAAQGEPTPLEKWQAGRAR